jgi:quercetin dioxygenase-like cupin family protein
MSDGFDIGRLRRVVVGLDADGRSTIARDEPSPNVRHAAPGVRYTELWSTPAPPAQAGEHLIDAGDIELTLVPRPGGTLVRVCEMLPPGPGEESYAMHATPTVDYIVVLCGQLRCAVEDGGSVILGPGETLVQRGTPHAWSAVGADPCTFLAIIVDMAVSPDS